MAGYPPEEDANQHDEKLYCLAGIEVSLLGERECVASEIGLFPYFWEFIPNVKLYN